MGWLVEVLADRPRHLWLPSPRGALDRVPGGTNATINGSPAECPGPLRVPSIGFNSGAEGNTNYLRADGAAVASTDHAVTFWVNAPGSGGYTIYSESLSTANLDYFAINTAVDGTISFRPAQRGGGSPSFSNTTAKPLDSTWHLCYYQQVGTAYAWVIDGKEDVSGTNSNALTSYDYMQMCCFNRLSGLITGFPGKVFGFASWQGNVPGIVRAKAHFRAAKSDSPRRLHARR